MNRNMFLILVFFLDLIFAASCSVPTPKPVEITQIVPHTITVTKIVKETVLATQEPMIIAETLQPIEVDQKYFDGIVVISQYYTFLGNGLPGKAFDLFSSAAKSAGTKEEFVQLAASNFKSVKIISVLPYFYAIEQQGGQAKSDPKNVARFAVQIKAWGEGNMSGSSLNGELQILYLELIEEQEGWKIHAFATAPFP